MSLPSGGLKNLLASKKHIIVEEDKPKRSGYIKLRFTCRQYDAFRDACGVLGIVASHPDFSDFVRKALDADVLESSIQRQFVTPIVTAPSMFPKKSVPKAAAASDQRKASYFTNPIEATDQLRMLYKAVENKDDLKQDVDGGHTSMTDIRVLLNRYFTENELKVPEGIVVDEFIHSLVPEAMKMHEGDLVPYGDQSLIPKGDKTIIQSIVKELAF
jgi:hypothetical protein